ncbi:MAG: hypothetical protein C0467_11700 [Planctomycetaceae bacterium]|nr:hypothetical protein [Planctomycetaceae bacterium]
MTRWFAIASVALIATGVTLFTTGRSASNQLPPTGALQPPVAAAQPAESLDGTWELVSVIEDGKALPLDIVKQTMIKDARIVIKGPTVALIRPDGKIRTLAFVTDSKASPKTVDVAGEMRVGGKGIYMRDGDVLMICTRGSDTETRPTVMASLSGSDTFLMTFRRVDAAPVQPPVAQYKPPAPVAFPAEDGIRKTLIGTWGHQTDEQIVKVTFNSDGTFGLLRTYKKGFKKVFDQEDRTSGTWRLKDGEVTLSVIASTNRENIGQVYSYRISSINDTEVIYIETISGQRRVEWKLR